MREYEFLYIIQPDATPESEQEIHSAIDGLIAREDGLFLFRDEWGKRKLAYEVRKFQKGHYFVLSFLGSGKFIPELERLTRLNPDVLRFLTVLVEEDIVDVEARIARAKQDQLEQDRRREEREKIEAEREERDRLEAERTEKERLQAAEEAPSKPPEAEPGTVAGADAAEAKPAAVDESGAADDAAAAPAESPEKSQPATEGSE